jgi:Activator of Hsp90 ATPase homolog 1-like protein
MIKSVSLLLDVDASFELFTTRISDWWPPQNRHFDDPASTFHLLESGRFFERASDGREVDLGRVIEWERPRRIVLDFYVVTGPDKPTWVEIRFDADTAGTRITVEHRPKPESEDLWDARAPRYERAWDRVLGALDAFAARTRA